MSGFYELLQVTRQAHQQARKRNEKQLVILDSIRNFIQDQRKVHGGGLKKLYHQMPNKPLGRDKFIDYATKAGLALKRKRKYIKTTFSVFTIYNNLLANSVLTDINQAWSGDITYVHIGQKHAYVFLLMDLYSRRLLGYVASDSMFASVNVSCLRMAIKARKGQSLKDTIHHSDRGSQYIAGDYLMMLQDYRFKISMCSSALDNSFSERINRTIKEEYLERHRFETLDELQKILKQSVHHYNDTRPHLNLNMMTPVEYEKHILSVKSENRVKVIIAHEHK